MAALVAVTPFVLPARIPWCASLVLPSFRCIGPGAGGPEPVVALEVYGAALPLILALFLTMVAACKGPGRPDEQGAQPSRRRRTGRWLALLLPYGAAGAYAPLAHVQDGNVHFAVWQLVAAPLVAIGCAFVAVSLGGPFSYVRSLPRVFTLAYPAAVLPVLLVDALHARTAFATGHDAFLGAANFGDVVWLVGWLTTVDALAVWPVGLALQRGRKGYPVRVV